MKGASSVLLILSMAVVAILGYYNLEQQKTIQLLNDEILEQARLRHNLILKKHVLEQKLDKFELNWANENQVNYTDSTTLVRMNE